jgi:YfiH family protein
MSALTSDSEPSAHRSNAGTNAREAPAGDPAVPRLELVEWAERWGLVAGITARGSGSPPFSLGLWSDEPVGQVVSRWRAFCAALAPRFPTVVLSHQVHGTRVDWHEAQPLPNGWFVLDGLDGHATSAPGVLLTVTVADCIPVYLAVPRKGAVALLHAGWRGIAGGVLGHGIDLLKWRAFSKASEIVMHCGIGICGKCYEVGSEVALRFGIVGEGPVHLDLRGSLVDQARSLGVEQISVSPWCTAHDQAQFFSHRASGGRDGRMIAYLGKPRA